MAGVEVIRCNAHRLNAATTGALGIGDSVKTGKTKEMKALTEKLAACVASFNHSPRYASASQLKDFQTLQEELLPIYGLIRQNDMRWASQHKVMAHLLVLKKAILNYFSENRSYSEELSDHEWKITGEVCSLLDVVAEVDTCIRGPSDTHISQAMFNMTEVLAILKEDRHRIRTPDVTPASTTEPLATETMRVSQLTREAQKVREALVEQMGLECLGIATLKVERICGLLDPRRKVSSDEWVSDSSDMKMEAKEYVVEVVDAFVDDHSPETYPVSSSSRSPASPAGGGARAGGASQEPHEPVTKKPRISLLEERRITRLVEARVGRRKRVHLDLHAYMEEEELDDVDGFSLLGFWRRRGAAVTCIDTGEVVPAEMPHLALIARLYHGIESTSCQAERYFSALSPLIDSLRDQMPPSKVEQMMFLRMASRKLSGSIEG